MRILKYLSFLLAGVVGWGAAYDTTFYVKNAANDGYDIPDVADPGEDAAFGWDEGTNAPVSYSLTAFGQSVIAAANAAAMRTILVMDTDDAVTFGALTAPSFTTTSQSIYMNTGQTVSIKAGTGSPEGAVTAYIGSLWLATDGTTDTTLWRKEAGTGNTGWVAVTAPDVIEGTAVLSTGEAGGTKFLREDGDGTSSWQTISGGGDALVANPLSQFAATTSAQLLGVLSDESGSGVILTSTGIFSGTDSGTSKLFSAAAMGALEIDVTEMKNTLTITDVATVTFSATPSTGQIFGLTVKNTDTTDNALTIPSSYSENYNGARTTVTIPASGQVTLTWWYDGSQYNLYGDPVFPGDLTSDTTPTDSSVDIMTYTDVATGAMKSIPIDDLLALSGGGTTDDPTFTGTLTIGDGATASGIIKIMEDTDNGTNFASFQVPNITTNTTYILPAAYGSAGYQLTDAAGDGVLSWAAAGAGGGISNVVEDTTPQLGGALDAQGYDINNGGVIFLTEQAAAEADVSGKGQYWVESGAPNNPKFTNEAGSDYYLTVADSTIATGEVVVGTTGGSYKLATSGLAFASGVLGNAGLTSIELGHASDTSIARSAAGVITVEGARVVTAADPIIDADGATLTAANCYGTIYYVTGTSTFNLPAVSTGTASMSVTFIVVGAYTATINPDDGDLIIRDGTAQADGVDIDSTGTTGDIAVFTYYDSTGWYCSSNSWIAGT